MSEHFWLTVISILCTSTLIGLGILINMLFSWRRDFKGDLSKMENGLNERIAVLCDEKEKEHGEMWKRINHHAHNDGGRVIITEAH